MKREELEKSGKSVGTKCEQHSRLADKIVDYLYAKANEMFTQKELSQLFKRSEQQIRQTCHNLVDKQVLVRYENENAKSREARYYYGIAKSYAQKRAQGDKKVEKMK